MDTARDLAMMEAERTTSDSEDDEEDSLTEAIVDVEHFKVNFAACSAEKSRHLVFFSHCQLALSVALACTLCGVPVYSAWARNIIFGQRQCGKMDLLWKRELPNGTLVESNNTLGVFGGGGEDEVWCGYVPDNYMKTWPKFIQMIVFTAFQNTGATVKQAWQGVMGTAMAVLNICIMNELFPGETVTWIAWLDTFGFIFLVLLSGSAENTMKFALSTHVFFMMTFLDPNHSSTRGFFPTGILRISWDEYTVSVLAAAFAGCTVAVLATLVPSMLLNYKKVVSGAAGAQRGITQVWGEAIEYFCGDKVVEKRLVIAEAITSLNRTIVGVQSNLESSWWETFDLGKFGRKRRLYNIYDTAMQKMGRYMIAVQDSVITVDFGKGHQEFCSATHAGMLELKDATAELLEKCEHVCSRGEVDDEEAEELEKGVLRVRQCQSKLLGVFRTVANRPHLDHQIEFCFVLSVWARKTVDCAECMVECDGQHGQGFLHAAWQGLVGTLRWPSRSNFLWALRNFLSIAMAFTVGYQMPCWGEDAWVAEHKGGTPTCPKKHYLSSLFTPYDANMANTLGLLINHHPGAALINNIQRLLGVVMGKVIPMVIQGALFIAGVHKIPKSILIGVSLFIFTWLTTYMYYSSRRWALVGRLMAGFGCALLSRPVDEVDLMDYNANYKELAQVVMAICLQMTVDVLFELVQNDWPRDSAVKKVAELQGCIKRGFAAFFDGNLSTLLEASRAARACAAAAKALSPDVDPSLQLTPGYQADFRVDLYLDALLQLELLSNDLTMLVLAARKWCPDPTPMHSNDKSALEALEDNLDSESSDDEDAPSSPPFNTPGFLRGLDAVSGKNGVREELLRYIDVVLESLEAMLRHSAEDNNFQAEAKTRELINLRHGAFARLEELHEEIGSSAFSKAGAEDCVCEEPHAKVAMALRALLRAKARVGEIMRLMMPYIHL